MKFKSNAFWVIVAVVLLAEAAVYFVAVRGKAKANEQTIGKLAEDRGQIASMLKQTANQSMIVAAQKHKGDLNREYARMVLFCIGKDALLDSYDLPIPPQRKFDLSNQERMRLFEKYSEASQALAKDAAAARIGTDLVLSPWDLLKQPKGLPDATWLIHAHKMLHIQRVLLNIISKPAEGKQDALAPMLNKVTFKTPEISPGSAFMFHKFTLDVSMVGDDVTVLVARLLNSPMAFIISSCTVTKGTERSTAPGAGKIDVTKNLVTVRIDCKVFDFAMGISKVVFTKQKFDTPEAVSEWLGSQQDEALKVLASQLQQEDVKSTATNDVIEYVVYGDKLMLTEPKEVTCEIADGVSMTFGMMQQSVPDLGRIDR